jgi:hypothetical protein
MRDPARIDVVLIALGEYWKANPDLRLCQILGNFASAQFAAIETPELWHVGGDLFRAGPGTKSEPDVSARVYHTEDDVILRWLTGHAK